MTEWTPEAVATEAERRAAYEADGNCPDSGYTIGWCWDSHLCDCAYSPPTMCYPCGIQLWNLPDHIRRRHPNEAHA